MGWLSTTIGDGVGIASDDLFFPQKQFTGIDSFRSSACTLLRPHRISSAHNYFFRSSAQLLLFFAPRLHNTIQYHSYVILTTVNTLPWRQTQRTPGPLVGEVELFYLSDNTVILCEKVTDNISPRTQNQFVGT